MVIIRLGELLLNVADADFLREAARLTAKLPNDVTSRAISCTQAGPTGVEKLFELLRNKNIIYRSNAKVVPSGAPFAVNPAVSNIVEVAKNGRISQVPAFQISFIHVEIGRIFYLATGLTE